MLVGTALLLASGAFVYVYCQREEENDALLRARRSLVTESNNDRLAERLAQKQLTPAEMQAFIELQNKRVIEPQSKEFVSKHQFSKTDVAARLQAIDWFANCGKPMKLDLTMPVQQAASWEEAVDACVKPEAKTSRLHARNQLSEWLHVNAHDRGVARQERAVENEMYTLAWGDEIFGLVVC